MKKDRILITALLLALVLSSMIFTGCEEQNAKTTGPRNAFSGGQGTSEDPYQISTTDDLIKLSDKLNVDNWDSKLAGACYIQTADIDLKDVDWVPIGYYHTQSKPFRGIYDGNGFKISNLSINKTQGKVAEGEKMFSYGQGLFAFVEGINNDQKAMIKNVYVVNADLYYSGAIGTKTCVGAIAGAIGRNAEVVNCKATGIASADGSSSYTGGIAGQNSGLIKDCAAGVRITSSSKVENGSIYAGGLVAHNYGNIENCMATGITEADASNCNNATIDVGGLVARNDSTSINVKATIKNSFAEGSVNGIGTGMVGGLVSYNAGEIENCYAIETVSLRLSGIVSGLVAYNSSGTISNSYASGEITLNPSNTDVAAVAGWNETGIIENCYFDYGLFTGIKPVNGKAAASVTGKSTDEMNQQTFIDLLNKNSKEGNAWALPKEGFYPVLSGNPSL